MSTNYTKRIVLTGLMTALVFLATYFTHIPTPLPGGYFNLGDTVIIIAAIVLGRRSGLFAGAVGSFLADIAFGAFIFAPVTFIVKGLEGFVVGAIASSGKDKSGEANRVVSVIVGAVIMVAGYFIAEAFILGAFNEAFGLTAAITELPANLIQGGISAVVGYVLSAILLKVNVKTVVG